MTHSKRSRPPSTYSRDSPRPRNAGADHPLVLAEAQATLIARLSALSEPVQAAALTQPTIAAFRDYVAVPDSDKIRAAQDLIEVSRILSIIGQTADALSVHEAADEISAGVSPS